MMKDYRIGCPPTKWGKRWAHYASFQKKNVIIMLIKRGKIIYASSEPYSKNWMKNGKAKEFERLAKEEALAENERLKALLAKHNLDV